MDRKWIDTLFVFKRQEIFSTVLGGVPIDKQLQPKFPDYEITIINAQDWDAPRNDDSTGGMPSQEVINESLSKMKSFISKKTESESLIKIMEFEGIPGTTPIWIAYVKDDAKAMFLEMEKKAFGDKRPASITQKKKAPWWKIW